MKKVRVFGNTSVTVSTIITVQDDATDEEIMEAAEKHFQGISSFCGNGGMDKLIGVNGEDDTISADEPVSFDDYTDC